MHYDLNEKQFTHFLYFFNRLRDQNVNFVAFQDFRKLINVKYKTFFN